MKIKILLLVGLGALACAGAAQAAGLFDGSNPESALLQREKALVKSMHASDGATASSRGKRGRKGPRGARGPKGVKGVPGPAGPAGSFSTITSVKGPTVFLAPFPQPGAVGSSSASCPPGSKAIGGGWQGGGILATVGYNAPGSGDWSVIMTNNDELSSTSFNAIVLCAS